MNKKIKTQYETDFYEWLMCNAKLLRDRKIDEIDFENIAEEIESVGRSERWEVINRLAILIMHLLKWQYQAIRRGNSWQATISEQRSSIEFALQDSPSLRPKLPEFLERAYRTAIYKAIEETGMNESIFPKICPYTLEQIFDSNFYPGEI